MLFYPFTMSITQAFLACGFLFPHANGRFGWDQGKTNTSQVIDLVI